MSPYQKNQKEKKRKNLFRKWHRWIGFSSAFFLLNLAITGIILNHSDELQLHNYYVKSNWLVSWYGVKAPEKFNCVQHSLNSEPLCQTGNQIIKNKSTLIKTRNSLLGLIEIENLFFLATESAVHIFTADFQLVESLDTSNGLPARISKFGYILNEGRKQLSIKTQYATWALDLEENLWEVSTHQFYSSSPLINASQFIESELKTYYLSHQISYLKLVQDIHSGRILNMPGTLLIDFSGLIIILLSISGFIAWQKRTKQ